MMIHRTFTVTLLLVNLVSLFAVGAVGQQPPRIVRPLPLIDPGTIVHDEGTSSWNRVILVATPSLNSGDTNALAQNIREIVSSFQLVLMAKTQSIPDTSNVLRHHLVTVGVGYAARIRDLLTIVDPNTSKELGLPLSFVANQILSENYRQLSDLKCIAHSSTVLVFDVPSVMLRNQQHRDFITRHLLWIDTSSGKLSLLVWLLDSNTKGEWQIVQEPFRWMATPIFEKRNVHIDGSSFFLGVPGKRAFAVEELPPGKEVAWTRQLEQLAAKEILHSDLLVDLCEEFNQALASLRE